MYTQREIGDSPAGSRYTVYRSHTATDISKKLCVCAFKTAILHILAKFALNSIPI